MQVVRDAIVLLVVVLIVATVRVSPVPEIALSPAQAAEASRPASDLETPKGAAVPARDPAMVDPAASDENDDHERLPCDQSVTARSKDRQSRRKASVAPCDA